MPQDDGGGRWQQDADRFLQDEPTLLGVFVGWLDGLDDWTIQLPGRAAQALQGPPEPIPQD